MRFTVEIAEIPIEICCRYSENKAFMEDFMTHKEPCITVEVTEKELAAFRKWTDELVSQGFEEYRFSEPACELVLIHNKLSQELLNYDILLVHGSAISMDGDVYLFTAPSGTGKSTHTRLWRETFGDRTMMINDDKPMLKIQRNRIEVYGTPWRGKHHLGCNDHRPLKAIIELNRGPENRIRRISTADAFPVIRKQAISFQDVGLMTKILSLEKTLAETIPFYRLNCNMEREAALIAWQGMNQEKILSKELR